MAEETTTSTTDTTTESTTETTTEAQNQDDSQQSQETATTTVVSSEASIPAVEHQGEQVVDQGARAEVVGDTTNEQTAADNIEQAKRDGLANHAAAEASQPATTTRGTEKAAE